MKVKTSTIFLFFAGFGTGFLLNLMLNPNLDHRYKVELNVLDPNAETFQEELKQMTMDDVKKIRILCVVDRAQKNSSYLSWGKHCDKIIFASTLIDITLGGMLVIKLIMQYIHKNFIDDYDWFFKCDDDTFLIAENMRYLLSAYSPEDPVYFGYKLNTSMYKRGNFTEGSGFVVSRKTVRVFVEQILAENDSQVLHNNTEQNECHIEMKKQVEDLYVDGCLDSFNIYAGDGHDELDRNRFHALDFMSHLFPATDLNEFWSKNEDGFNCCSNYSTLFHFSKPNYQYTLYYLTYKLQIYGIDCQFPSPPTQKNFTESIYILNRERNISRGY